MANRSWRDLLALGAAWAMPPGVCCESPVHRTRGCCLSRLITAISRSVPYCWPSSITRRERSCMKPLSVDHCMVRSCAIVPPVAITSWHLFSICLLSLGFSKSKRTKEKHFHGPIFGTVWQSKNETAKSQNPQQKADPCNKQKKYN